MGHLPASRGRSLARRAAVGGRGRCARDLDVSRPATKRRPAGQCADRAGRPRRRQGGDHPSAAPGNRDRAHRLLPTGRHRGAAVVPVRPRRAGIQARRFRSEAGIRRRRVVAEPGHDPRAAAAIGARGRRGRRARVVDGGLAATAGPGRGAVHAGRDARHRRRAARLHQRHDRPAQGRAHAAPVPAGQPARVRALARRLSAGG